MPFGTDDGFCEDSDTSDDTGTHSFSVFKTMLERSP